MIKKAVKAAFYDAGTALREIDYRQVGRADLEEAHSVDEAKEFRDKAVALEDYARQAKDKEILHYAGEIKLRAERRAGELLKSIKANGENKPGRSNETTNPKNSPTSTSPKTKPANGKLLRPTYPNPNSWKLLQRWPKRARCQRLKKSLRPLRYGIHKKEMLGWRRIHLIRLPVSSRGCSEIVFWLDFRLHSAAASRGFVTRPSCISNAPPRCYGVHSEVVPTGSHHSATGGRDHTVRSPNRHGLKHIVRG